MSVSEQYLNIDPKMLWEIASGMEDPSDIARRYGISSDVWAVLSRREELIRQVEQFKAELAASGQTFKNKAKLMADTLLDRTYRAAIDPDCPLKDRVAALQLLSKLGELEPKSTLQAQGAGFSISINIPASINLGEDTKKNVIEAEEVPVMDKPMQLSFSTEKE